MITFDDLKAMGYVFQGQPFVVILAEDTIDLEAMGYVFQGQPFVTVAQVQEVEIVPGLFFCHG